eukprot:495859_1
MYRNLIRCFWRHCIGCSFLMVFVLLKVSTVCTQNMALRRITKELKELQDNPTDYPNILTIKTNNNDLFTWNVTIVGAQGTPYQNGQYDLKIVFPMNYPFKPPKIQFLTKIYHCNINDKGGISCDILKDSWSPAMTTSKLLMLLQLCMITGGDVMDPLVPNIAKLMRTNITQFLKIACEWNIKYAKGDSAPNLINESSFQHFEPWTKTETYKKMYEEHEKQIELQRKVNENEMQKYHKTRFNDRNSTWLSTTKDDMKLYVKSLNGKITEINCRQTDFILTIKMLLEKKDNIPANLQRFVYAGKQLSDYDKLVDTYIYDGATLHLLLNLFVAQEVPKTYKDCTKEILECPHLINLRHILHNQDVDPQLVNDVVNDFIHIIHFHDTLLEEICNNFGHCDVTKCVHFSRNYRVKQPVLTPNDEFEIEGIVFQQITDKIHCYFSHCFDIGHRLRDKDNTEISELLNVNQNQNKQDDACLTQVINQEKLMIKERCLNHTKNICTQYAYKRYSQIFEGDSTEYHKDKHEIYSFGFRFEYAENSHSDEKQSVKDDASRVIVTPRYESFKQELIQNDVCRLTAQQFQLENKKTEIHFKSYYCKEQFVEKTAQTSHQKVRFKMYHILAIMIYCNYTQMQSLFSKTYRENKGKHHNNFY